MSSLLIDALDRAIMESGNREQVAELETMRTNEKEKILRDEKGWDAKKKIYVTNNGYYKTRLPIQICRAKRSDIIDIMYEHFFGTIECYTLNDCFRHAMDELANDVNWRQRKITTKQIYEADWIRFYAKSPIAKRSIKGIKAKDVTEHLKRIVYENDLDRKGLNNAKTILNRAFDWAVNNDIITTNIARNISTSDIVCREVDQSSTVYTDAEREKLLTVMESDDHVASRALALMFCLCIRSGEVRALKWSDVDWNNSTIYIHSQISRSRDENGRLLFIDEGTTKNHDATGKRYQRLSNRAIEILQKQKNLSPFSTYIFEQNNHVLGQDILNRRLKKLCEIANVPYLSTHKIRFWSVTKMVASGVSPVEVQAQAGHKCRQTTDYYVRVGRQDVLDNNVVEAIYG